MTLSSSEGQQTAVSAVVHTLIDTKNGGGTTAA